MENTKKINRNASMQVALIIAIAFLLALLMNSCTCKSNSANWDYSYSDKEAYFNRDRQNYFDAITEGLKKDTARWNQFLECSKNEGDAGCDSCMMLIFGFSTLE